MFHTLRLEDKALFDSYKGSGISHSQYNFTNLFMWKHEYNPEIAVIDGLLCIVINYFGHRMAMFPVGSGDYEKAITKIFEAFGNITLTALDSSKVEILKSICPNNLVFTNVRKNYDYVYKTEKLMNLSGRKLHSKRNHLKKFLNRYNFEYKKINNNLIQYCEIIERKWIDSKNLSKRASASEYQSTMNVLDNYEYLGCRGGIIFIDGNPAAYAVGEMANDNMAVIHIEKAVGGFDGIYAAINQMCVENEFSESVFINREEDMGQETLRKAKLSYYPDIMLEYKRARIFV